MFFLFDSEKVHISMVGVGRFLGEFRASRTLMRTVFDMRSPESVVIDGIRFPTRVGLSAGFDWNADLLKVTPSLGFGFHTIGTLTHEEYEGNRPPRLGRFPDSKALLVNKGFKNAGIKSVIQRLSGFKSEIPYGISIASTNKNFLNQEARIKDILGSFKACETAKNIYHTYYELNISCPNTKEVQPYANPKTLAHLLNVLDKLKIKKPIYVKMPIDLSQKETIGLLDVIAKSKISGVIFGNLTKDHKNPDVTKADRQRWEKVSGNLSGKPTWKRSNELIALTKKRYKDRFTIIGTGGIFGADDAKEKIRLGADLVQLITGMIFEGPQIVAEIAEELS